MLGPGVDLQLAQLGAGDPVAREHPLDREPKHLLGPPLDHLGERPRAQAAGVARVAVVELFLALATGDRVNDDDEVADVAVRRVLGLVLAAQRVGDLGREPSERLAGSVDDEPLALAILRCGYVGLHA